MLEAQEPVLVQEFMTDSLVTASPDTSVQKVAQRMMEAGVHRVIIVDEEHCPVGIITSLDLVGILARE